MPSNVESAYFFVAVSFLPENVTTWLSGIFYSLEKENLNNIVMAFAEGNDLFKLYIQYWYIVNATRHSLTAKFRLKRNDYWKRLL